MEVLVVFILFVLAPLAVFRGIKSLRDSKYKAMAEGFSSPSRDDAGSGAALRQSELRALIDDAVIEATAPLAARVDELERELLLGEGRIDRATLAEAFEEAEEDDAPEAAASGRRRQQA